MEEDFWAEWLWHYNPNRKWHSKKMMLDTISRGLQAGLQIETIASTLNITEGTVKKYITLKKENDDLTKQLAAEKKRIAELKTPG